MPRTCLVCQHEKRSELDQALVNGEAYRSIAQRFGISDSALFRHKREHVSAALVAAKGAVEAANANTLLERISELAQDARRITKRAEHSKQLSVALQGISALRGILELLAKLSGQLQTNLTLDVSMRFTSAAQARERIQTVCDKSGFSLTVLDRMDDPVYNEKRIAELLAEGGYDMVPRRNVLTIQDLDHIVQK